MDSENRFYAFVKIYDLKGIKKSEREKMEVKEIADKDYPHFFPTDNVYHTLNVMIKHNLGRIPVIIEKNNEAYIIGIISKTDVIKAYEHLME